MPINFFRTAHISVCSIQDVYYLREIYWVSSKVRNKTRVPTFTITIQHSFGSFGHSNQSRKRNKRNPNWKRRSKTLTADDKILYIENPKDSTRKLLELINEYSKVAGYKINPQKSLEFLYTNEKTEREIKETIPFTISTKGKPQFNSVQLLSCV